MASGQARQQSSLSLYRSCCQCRLCTILFPSNSYIQLLSNIGLRYIQSIPKMSSKTIKTKSGIQINPFASLNDLLDGTSFQQDKVTQGHLESLGGAFREISKTDEGQVLLTAMEGQQTHKFLTKLMRYRVCVYFIIYSAGLAKRIKTDVSFKDAVKVCFRLAKKITSNPWVQFGMFIGLFGLLIALIAHFGTMTVLGAGFSQAARSLGMFIISSALMPISHGVKQSVEFFMKGPEDFVDKRK